MESDINSNHIIAIIPARGGSKSIPRKNIIDFCGKPLIVWSIEQAQKSKSIQEVFITTDDREITEVARQSGAVVIQRPRELATDIASSEAALLHAIAVIEKQRKIDLVVFLQATSPLREKGDIDNAIDRFLSEGADSLFSASVLDDFCAWRLDNGVFRSVTFNYQDRGRRQDRQPLYLENGSIYIFKPEILKQYSNRLGGNITIYPMPVWKSCEIDDMEGFAICEYYMRHNNLINQPKINSLNNIELIVYDFDGVLTDNKVILSEDGFESVKVNRSDGLAVSIIKSIGIKQLILSKETNKVVSTRAVKLGIPVIRGIDNKKETLISYCDQHNISLQNVIYLGNDINDLAVMEIVGYPLCPSDAYDEIKSISKIILNVAGGSGVVRELLRLIGNSKKIEGRLNCGY